MPKLRREQKTDKDEIYSAVEFKQGDWIVKFDGKYFSLDDQQAWRVAILRFYKKGELQWIGCASIVRTVKSKDVIMRWSGRLYRLRKEISTQIEDNGGLLC